MTSMKILEVEAIDKELNSINDRRTALTRREDVLISDRRRLVQDLTPEELAHYISLQD